MKILYSWLKDYAEIVESPEKLAKLLSTVSFETVVTKKIGTDAVFEIGLLPNRVADASGHFGIAREVALIKGKKLEFPAKRPNGAGDDIRKTFSCDVLEKTECRRYMLAGMTGVGIGDSPQWLKKRLLACGIRPINNVVDAANYAMLELGQPLHAFDADKVVGKRIIVRFANKGEKIETIEKKAYDLFGSEVLIADRDGPLALAGVKGGRRAEISQRTSAILIESANFNSVSTRETSKLHALKTDASWRFENDLDPNAVEIALWRALALIKEVAGGDIMNGVFDYYPKKVLARPIAIDTVRISRLIGKDIRANTIRNLILPFCRSIKMSGSGKMFLKIETHRRDIKYFEDVAEEVARLIGYNAIVPVSPVAELISPARNEEVAFRERLCDEMVRFGFSETYNYSFVSAQDISRIGVLEEEIVELENPVSGEHRYLRRTLLPNLLKNARDNLRFFQEVRMFEIGKQYKRLVGKSSSKKSAPDLQPEEKWQLAGIITGRGVNAKDAFDETKGVIEALLERFGLDSDDYEIVSPENDSYFLPGAFAEVLIDGRGAARIGVLQDEILRAYDVGAPAAYWSIDVELLRRAVAEEHEFEPLHKYPDIIRDISVLVPAFTKIEEVESAIADAGAKYIEDTDLFDVYDEGLPKDKVSMAFHLIFRAPDRTLTDEEVNEEIKKIIKALKSIGAEIR